MSWAGLHCADPPGPGVLSLVSGIHSATITVSPSSCGGSGGMHSVLSSFPLTEISTVGIALTPDGLGYRLVDDSGVIANGGNATAFTGAPVRAPVVAIRSAPSGNGVWTAASDGGVFAYGSAGFHGSLGNLHLNAPVVGMAATPDGGGYWLVASDGGVFAFGDAAFNGSLGSVLLAQPVVAIAAGPHRGYWLLAADGGIFTFGGVPFEGSAAGGADGSSFSGFAATPSGAGYSLVASNGSIVSFGDGRFAVVITEGAR